MVREYATPPAGLRWSRQRELIVSTLDTPGNFATAQELHARLCRDGHRIGISTVYRTLAELENAQRLNITRQEGGERGYQLRPSPDGVFGENGTPAGMIRWTRQRELIVSALEADAGFTSVQELHARLRREGHRIGMSTVYRTLAELERGQWLDIVRQETGERRYQLRSSRRHRHHLICRQCGDSTALDSDVVEKWIDELPRTTGFIDIRHALELDGVCTRCSTSHNE
ncbi:transcriptional repressor [Nocardia grenadensis]